jgi:Ca-activated chloride channel homolog
MKLLPTFLALLGAAAFVAPAAALTPVAPSPVRLTAELDRPVLGADRPETVILKVGLYGERGAQTERLPVNLALVIDKSGSMDGDKIERAREAALHAVRMLASDDLVSLVAYDNGVHTLVPARRVGDGRALESAIREITAEGGTNLHGGVSAGAAELRRGLEERRVHRVLLLSDGQANVGPSSPEALGRLGTELAARGITVSTIGLGLDYNEDLMTRLARRGEGNTYFVERSADLRRVFERELGDILSLVARRAVVEITLPEGARAVRIVGREGRVDDRRVVVELGNIAAEQEKFALVEIAVMAGTAEASRELANVSVNYEYAADGGVRTQDARAAARFSDRDEEVVAAVNKPVQVAYAENRLAEAKDEAIALADQGDNTGASAKLRQVSLELGSFGDRYKNAAVSIVAAPAAASALEIEREGLDNAGRKRLRTDAEQTRSQQISK